MNSSLHFNERMRQVVIFAIIIIIGIILIGQLSEFIPGILGAITLYIVSRVWFFKLIYVRKWKKPLTALLFIIGFFVIIALPIYFSITLISPKISQVFSNQQAIKQSLVEVADKFQSVTGIKIFSDNTMENVTAKISAFLPKLLNSSLGIITNLAIMFFLYYYLLIAGDKVERTLANIIPLKKESINTLAKETRMMVNANALGIPLISIVQGIVATIGYIIFGVKDWGMWGFITGVFAFFPIIGTMAIWVPLVISLFATGNTGMAIGLLIYSLVVTGNVDYLARMTLMKKMGDVHPVITVLGVIVGMNLFGFIGLVFGPLLISYFLILVKIYVNEFSASKTATQEPRENS